MKKIVSMVLMLVIVLSLGVSVFAATKAELITEINNAPAFVSANAKTQAIAAVNAMASDAEAGKVDVPGVKAAVTTLQTKVNAGTVTVADVNAAVTEINTKLGGAATVAISNLKIDTATGTITASATATVGGQTFTVNSVGGSWTVAGGTAAGGTAGPVKRTGASIETVAIVVGLTIVTFIGVASIKARKLKEV